MEKIPPPPMPPLLQDWEPKGVCRNGDLDAQYVQGAEQHEAKLKCRRCPVRRECAAQGLNNGIEEKGVWGGMTEREKRQLLLACGFVIDWRNDVLKHFPKQFTHAQLMKVATGIGGKLLEAAAAGKPVPPRIVCMPEPESESATELASGRQLPAPQPPIPQQRGGLDLERIDGELVRRQAPAEV